MVGWSQEPTTPFSKRDRRVTGAGTNSRHGQVCRLLGRRAEFFLTASISSWCRRWDYWPRERNCKGVGIRDLRAVQFDGEQSWLLGKQTEHRRLRQEWTPGFQTPSSVLPLINPIKKDAYWEVFYMHGQQVGFTKTNGWFEEAVVSAFFFFFNRSKTTQFYFLTF